MDKPPLLIRWGTQDLVVVTEVMDGNEYELPFRFEDTDVIVDIGAHIGVFAYSCLIRGCGKVLCFEPEKDNYDLCVQNLKTWRENESALVFNVAVWDKEQTLKLEVWPNNFTAMHRTVSGVGEDVLALSIKDILQKAGPSIRLLKLDCEGAEKQILDVLEPEDVKGVKEIVGELHYQLFAQGSKPMTDEWLVATMERLGFTSLKIVPHNNDKRYVSNFWAKK